MKNINKLCIISHARTGSNFLSHHLPSTETQYNAGEFFSPFIPGIIDCLRFILEHPPIPSAWINLIIELTNGWKEPSEGCKIPPSMRVQLFYEIINTVKNYNYQFFISKIMMCQLYDEYTLDNLLEDGHYLLFNYRKNIMHMYFSTLMAKETNIWIMRNRHNQKAKSEQIQYYNKLTSNVKVTWDYDAYIKYHRCVTNSYNKMKDFIMRKGLEGCIVQYEQLCETKNKILFIKSKISDADFAGLLIEESDTTKLKSNHNYDYVLNKKDFLQDMRKLSMEQIYYYDFDDFCDKKR